MGGLAAASGVGKQTIYRWWPSKATIVAEALSELARDRVPDVDTGSVLGDMTAFLVDTFKAASNRTVSRALRTLMAEAQSDPRAADILHAYTVERRQAMTSLLRRGHERGELRAGIDLDVIVDQAFGFIWYRLMIGHAPLDRRAATALARSLI